MEEIISFKEGMIKVSESPSRRDRNYEHRSKKKKEPKISKGSPEFLKVKKDKKESSREKK